tara:strand:- start:163 stop:378 length:216 start_codon:yes stop_codon:yes gene_type:complete
MVDFEDFINNLIVEEPEKAAMNQALLEAYKKGLVEAFYNADKNDFDIAISSSGRKAYLIDVANKYFEPAES